MPSTRSAAMPSFLPSGTVFHGGQLGATSGRPGYNLMNGLLNLALAFNKAILLGRFFSRLLCNPWLRTFAMQG